jgi:hypothetical protein
MNHQSSRRLNRRRRALKLESLCGRLLLAADLGSEDTAPESIDLTTETSLVASDIESGNAARRDSAASHPADRFDVNGDGRVSPLDALIVLNKLSRSVHAEQAESESEPHCDVNRDGYLSPLDLLQIFNHLARHQVDEVNAEYALAADSWILDIKEESDSRQPDALRVLTHSESNPEDQAAVRVAATESSDLDRVAMDLGILEDVSPRTPRS